MSELKNKEGQKVPTVTFPTRVGTEWVDIKSSEIFEGKTVVLFSLPGAFTPTCSSAHVPRYNQLVKDFKKAGVDEIVCMSVNDTFVMNEWQKDQNAENIKFIADGNTEFTDGMGMLVDKSNLGFGKRSWRYSMLVKDGVVEKHFIEPDVEGDPFEVSDADTMYDFITDGKKPSPSISILTREGCPFCAKAKSDLSDAGFAFETLTLGKDFSDITLRALSPELSFPQVFVNGDRIGGSEATEKWIAENK